jgi:methylglyoxal/glyoxal reductase
VLPFKPCQGTVQKPYIGIGNTVCFFKNSWGKSMKKFFTLKNKTHSDCTVQLSNGVNIPVFGLGVWQSAEGAEVENAVFSAIKNGYRLIDTAAIYENELGCGNSVAKAMKELNIARQEIFITSKLWNQDVREQTEKKAFELTLQKLQLKQLDLYLVHWPIYEKLETSWKAMEEIYETQKVRAVGVSNYHVSHLKQIAKNSKLVPHLNQIECHPFLQQKELRSYCADHGIAFQAWSPLMQGNFTGIETLEKISKKHKKSNAQIILRWNLQSNILTIPKSVKESRIIENATIFGFELDENDLKQIETLDCGKRFGPNPENFNF